MVKEYNKAQTIRQLCELIIPFKDITGLPKTENDIVDVVATYIPTMRWRTGNSAIEIENIGALTIRHIERFPDLVITGIPVDIAQDLIEYLKTQDIYMTVEDNNIWEYQYLGCTEWQYTFNDLLQKWGI